MATFRKLPSGKTQAIIRIAGHKPVSKSFNNKRLANQWVKLTEDMLNAGTHVSADADHTIADLLGLYLNTITNRACYATDRYIQRPLCANLKHYKVSTLTDINRRLHHREG